MKEVGTSLREVAWAGGYLLLVGASILMLLTAYMSIRTKFRHGLRAFGFPLKLMVLSIFFILTRYSDICVVGLPTLLIVWFIDRIAPMHHFLNLCRVQSDISKSD